MILRTDIVEAFAAGRTAAGEAARPMLGAAMMTIKPCQQGPGRTRAT